MAFVFLLQDINMIKTLIRKICILYMQNKQYMKYVQNRQYMEYMPYMQYLACMEYMEFIQHIQNKQ